MKKEVSDLGVTLRLFLLWLFVVWAFWAGGIVGGAIAAAIAMFLFWGLWLLYKRDS